MFGTENIMLIVAGSWLWCLFGVQAVIAVKWEVGIPPTLFISAVWEHFDFPINYINTGEKAVEKTKAVCRLCYTVLGFVAGNASNMLTHLRQHYLSVYMTRARQKQPLQASLSVAFNFSQEIQTRLKIRWGVFVPCTQVKKISIYMLFQLKCILPST